MKEETIKLTGTTLTVIALHIDESTTEQLLVHRLVEKVEQSPQFFHKSPIVIDLGQLTPQRLPIDLRNLVKHCRAIGLQPMAFKNVHIKVDRKSLPLPVLTSTSKNTELAAPEKETVVQTVTEEKVVYRSTKTITQPVRSGQQIYAEGTDLIVLSHVSEGSEVIADGNIHIYGSLRGRALAGVRGDTTARIFCRQLNAELIAIAGNFLLSDSVDDALKNQAVMVSLKDDRLLVDALK